MDMSARFFVITVSIMLCSLLAVGCGMPTVRQLKHQPSLAAESAEQFARTAFLERDTKSAYDLMWDESKRRYTSQQIEEVIHNLHTAGYPSSVEATDYEPIFGQPAMNIFLHGSSQSEEFYYRFVMMGTADTGYKVSDILRGSGPYPPSSLRKSLK